MIALDELKEIVLNNLENTGYLDNVRADLKSSVYSIIEKQNYDTKRKAGFVWEHPGLGKISSTREGSLGIDLIGEFLEHYKLDYTLSVFKKEVHKKRFNRDDIIDDMKIRSQPHHDTSILVFLIQDYIRIMQSGFTAKHSLDQSSQNLHHSQNSFGGGGGGSSQEFKKSPISDSKPNERQKSLEDEETLKRQREEEEAEKQRQLEEWQKEQDRLEEEREKERQEQEEKERIEKIEREFREKEEQEKKEQEEKERKKKEKEEKRRKKMEKAKKKKKLPATAVNTIQGAGGIGENQDALAMLYGSAITGQPQQQYQDPYEQYDPNDPYAYDAEGDPYGGQIQEQNNYDYDIDKPFGQSKYGVGGGDPYAAIDMDKQLDDKDIENMNYLDEEIDEFDASYGQEQYKDKDRRNPMFTSSEDYYGASQSQGFDQSVDSDAIELYDHYERIRKQ